MIRKVKVLILSVSISLLLSTSAAGDVSGLSRLLPTWPVNNIGDDIPASTVDIWRSQASLCGPKTNQYSAFPEKRSAAAPKESDSAYAEWKKEHDLDADSSCDDGDQTLFNGMLCASGDERSCVAVQEAQGSTGRWFRSPHRRWMWATRCVAQGPNSLSKQRWSDDCANGFSADMGLGVMLYTMHRHDVSAWRRWLSWLDSNANSTELCKLDDHLQPHDCVHAPWPRYCTDDLGYTDKLPAVSINGRYGGQCAFRPWDFLDFVVVDEATRTTAPEHLAANEIESRDLMKGFASTLPPPMNAMATTLPPMILLSSFEGNQHNDFSVHLDAVRVLLRMMILNPSLKLDNLPANVDISKLVADAINPGAADGADMVSIHASAAILAKRVPWNPFYRLLGDGPTPAVRRLILDACPDQSTPVSSTDQSNWLWQESDNDATHAYSKPFSMRWDCIFVANLYNKMRLKKDLLAEFVKKVLALVDHTDDQLSLANGVLQQAQAATDLEQKAFDEANRKLDDARAFADHIYAQKHAATLATIAQLNQSLLQLQSQQAAMLQAAASLASQAQARPSQIPSFVTNKVCKWAGPLHQLCKNITSPVNIANPVVTSLMAQSTAMHQQAIGLANGAITNARNQVAQSGRELADLDQELADTTHLLATNALHEAIALHQKELLIRNIALQTARRAVNMAREAHDQAVAAATVWAPKDS